MARPSFSWSAYSKSPPTGRPLARHKMAMPSCLMVIESLEEAAAEPRGTTGRRPSDGTLPQREDPRPRLRGHARPGGHLHQDRRHLRLRGRPRTAAPCPRLQPKEHPRLPGELARAPSATARSSAATTGAAASSTTTTSTATPACSPTYASSGTRRAPDRCLRGAARRRTWPRVGRAGHTARLAIPPSPLVHGRARGSPSGTAPCSSPAPRRPSRACRRPPRCRRRRRPRGPCPERGPPS